MKKILVIGASGHVGSYLVKELIKENFNDKNVYAVGATASKFRFMGSLDKPENLDLSQTLLIVLDTPDKKRVDGVNPDDFKYKIKIDHHPFVEEFCDIEHIDSTASSASQLVMELVFKTKLKLNKEAAAKLYIGLIGDTDRFLYDYTTSKTFSLVAKLIEETGLEFTKLYEKMYLRPYKEIKFQSYILQNMVITENGFAYIKLPQDVLDEFNVDASTAGNMVNNFNYIDEFVSWAVFSYDKANDYIKGSIRSRGPIINEVAKQFGGGGHIYASGVKLKDFSVVDEIVKELDKVCLEYMENKVE